MCDLALRGMALPPAASRPVLLFEGDGSGAQPSYNDSDAIALPMAADRALARSIKEVHETPANAMLAPTLLHATAAQIQHWVLRDRTLVRTLPGSLRQAAARDRCIESRR